MERDNIKFEENSSVNEQSEAEKILGSMPSFEEHMAEIKAEAEREQLTDPNNGGALLSTDRSNILRSELSDVPYYVHENNEIVPLKSPINGGELTPTNRPDIMSSEYDDILYKVTEQGQIIPLKSPINGGPLTISDGNLFEDPATGQEFELDATGKLNLRRPEE